MVARAAAEGGGRQPGSAPRRAIRYRDSLVVALTLTTGAVDAVSYLRLGKVFSSIITGDLALLGVAAGQGHGALAVNGGLALAGYGLGALAGGAIAGIPAEGQPPWPLRSTAALAAELLVLAGFGGGWLAAGGHPAGAARLALLGLAAASMGMQSAAVRRLGQMSTTYLTATLTGLAQALAVLRWPPEWQRGVGTFLALAAGAACGSAAAVAAPSLVPAAMCIPLAAVVACSPPAARRALVLRALALGALRALPGRIGRRPG
jgi:uncharacterized membrane protein YoaK (UPF0700 family)